eukprot:2829911-Prorocentrum_lima.AAC.1
MATTAVRKLFFLEDGDPPWHLCEPVASPRSRQGDPVEDLRRGATAELRQPGVGLAAEQGSTARPRR